MLSYRLTRILSKLISLSEQAWSQRGWNLGRFLKKLLKRVSRPRALQSSEATVQARRIIITSHLAFSTVKNLIHRRRLRAIKGIGMMSSRRIPPPTRVKRVALISHKKDKRMKDLIRRLTRTCWPHSSWSPHSSWAPIITHSTIRRPQTM